MSEAATQMDDRSAIVVNQIAAAGDVVSAVPQGAEIESLADEVAGLIRGSELRCAYEVGRLVIERLYSGDPGGWHRHGPKQVTLARLADALALRGVGSPSALHVCLGVFETLAPLGEIASWKRLTRSHVRAVLPLPLAERHSLLRRAEDGGWSLRELETSVRRGPQLSKLGRPRHPAFVAGVRQIVAAVAKDAAAFQELHRIHEVDPDVIATLHTELMQARERLDLLQAELSPKRAAALRANGRLVSAKGPGTHQAGPRLVPAETPRRAT